MTKRGIIIASIIFVAVVLLAGIISISAFNNQKSFSLKTAPIPTPTPESPLPTLKEDLEDSSDSEKEMLNVVVFMGNEKKDPKSCALVYPVPRQIIKGKNDAREAIEELLEGPTKEEMRNGYYTNIPTGAEVNKVSVKNGVITVDFDETIERGIKGFCRITGIRSQIVQTLQQFPSVRKVVISVKGKTQNILQL